jgi:hypothetical protein
MSDGLSDCAYAAEAHADELMLAKWPTVHKIHAASHAPKQGTVLVCYEEWLTHIVELITDRQVIERWCCEPFEEPYRLKIGSADWPAGYYDNNRLPRTQTKRGWLIPTNMRWQND